MSRITTGKDKIPKNSILARIFGLRQGFKDISCPGQEIGETRTRYHPWVQEVHNALHCSVKQLILYSARHHHMDHYIQMMCTVQWCSLPYGVSILKWGRKCTNCRPCSSSNQQPCLSYHCLEALSCFEVACCRNIAKPWILKGWLSLDTFNLG